MPDEHELEHDEEHRVTPLERFFDLVFVSPRVTRGSRILDSADFIGLATKDIAEASGKCTAREEMERRD